MTFETTLAPALPGFSDIMVAMVEKMQPSVVQVQNQGRGIGAGVIWEATGTIITNHHVVAEERGPVSILLTDGREFEATVAGRNPTLDLALLKVPARDLPQATVANSSRLRVGELVFAIGHPWGRRGVVTAGIISGLGEVRAPGGRRSSQYIRSDVRLAPGNSGGPLLNAAGEVIGINAMIFGGDLSVAIPGYVVKEWVATLDSSGQAQRSVKLGVGVQPVEVRTEKPGDPVQKVAGLLVVTVQPNGLAARNKLLVGDILVEAGGQPLTEVSDLQAGLSHADGKLKVRLMRAGAFHQLDIKLG